MESSEIISCVHNTDKEECYKIHLFCCVFTKNNLFVLSTSIDSNIATRHNTNIDTTPTQLKSKIYNTSKVHLYV